jgi:hypothetical protein
MVDSVEEPQSQRNPILIMNPQALSVSGGQALTSAEVLRQQGQQYWLEEEENQRHLQTNQAVEIS